MDRAFSSAPPLIEATMTKDSPRSRSSASRIRPTLESLENRRVMSATVYQVTNTNDSGPGSLRHGINEVNAGVDNTIDFNIASSGTQTITLLSVLPTITKAVTINGTTEPGYTTAPVVKITAYPGVQGDGIFDTASNVSITGLAVDGFAGYGIHVGTSVAGASNVVLQSDVISGNQYRGIGIIDSKNVTVGGSGVLGNSISGNGINNPDCAGIAIVNGSSEVMAVNNTLSGNGRGFRISGAGSVVAPGQTASINVTDNTLTGNLTQGIWVDDYFGGPSHNVAISGNSVTNSGGAGLRIDDSSKLTITSNTLTGNGGIAGIGIINGASQITATGNSLSGNSRGFLISGSGATIATGQTASITLSSNTVTGSQMQGVWITDGYGGPARNIALTGDSITGSAATGLRIDHSSAITLDNDTISGNGFDGVFLTDQVTAVTFQSDVIENNGINGVEDAAPTVPLPSLTSNTITGNKKAQVVT